LVDGHSVPALSLFPDGVAKALVLLGHGGGGTKDDANTAKTAKALLSRSLAVLTIDGPVHGARRTDRADAAAVLAEFRAMWHAGEGGGQMARDWIATLDHLRWKGPVGYFGLSMGTYFGIPLLARAPRIAAAVLGLWGIEISSNRGLLRDAAQISCPTLFLRKRDDQIFGAAGTSELFAAIGSPRKTLHEFPGPHAPLDAGELQYACNFLERALAGATAQAVSYAEIQGGR
jgi:pimeloyl-ACP methyl ester carboxylesterase